MAANVLDRYRKVLADSVVFAQLLPAELERIMAACRVVDVSPGQTVIIEGQKGGALYIILDGEVEFFLPEQPVAGGRRPSSIRLNVLGPGRCFGEYALIDDQPSSASAQALKPTRLCVLEASEFHRIVDQNDRIGRIVYANLLRFLVGRLRAKDKELDLIVLLEAPPASS
jgi:CRP-like cAMP-binding protein